MINSTGVVGHNHDVVGLHFIGLPMTAVTQLSNTVRANSVVLLLLPRGGEGQEVCPVPRPAGLRYNKFRTIIPHYRRRDRVRRGGG